MRVFTTEASISRADTPSYKERSRFPRRCTGCLDRFLHPTHCYSYLHSPHMGASLGVRKLLRLQADESWPSQALMRPVELTPPTGGTSSPPAGLLSFLSWPAEENSTRSSRLVSMTGDI